MQLSTTGNLATLAAIFLAKEELSQAVSKAEEALLILDGCGGEGPEFPQRDYFSCYRVLAAVKQRSRAETVLRSAYDLTKGRANKITDPALRQLFLEQVAINREIIAEAKKVLGI
jgi:hypothetical protein